VTATAGPLHDFIESGTKILRLPIDPAWTPAITGHLDVILRLAALVTSFDLPEDVEPAPVYQASSDVGA
jgi:1-carboxybiuret hydrolase subunit AtzG-like protein